LRNVQSTYLQHNNHNMSLFNDLIGKLAPHNCLACAAEGSILCIDCTNKLAPVPERCYQCQRPSPGFITCTPCRTGSLLHKVRVSTFYETIAKTLIWQLKLAGVQDVAQLMAERLAARTGLGSPEALIVPVPTATSRRRQRGYDQAKLLARELSRQTRLPYYDCLVRHGQTHQHGLSRRERLVQLHNSFRATRPKPVHNAHIILVDDVVTTGATLEAAARTLQAVGARQIDAVVFAQPRG
jgi:ComF family protein